MAGFASPFSPRDTAFAVETPAPALSESVVRAEKRGANKGRRKHAQREVAHRGKGKEKLAQREVGHRGI